MYSLQQTFNPRALPSLPSYQDLTAGFRPCREASCSNLLRPDQSCDEHEQHSSFTSQYPQQTSQQPISQQQPSQQQTAQQQISQRLANFGFHKEPYQQVPLMHGQVNHRLPSPVSVSSHEDSSDNIYTPDASRQTSPVGNTRAAISRRASKIAARRGSRQTSIQVNNASDNRRDSVPVNSTSQLDKKVKKMQKEKNCRGAQAGVAYRNEDAFLVYTGWQRKEQSGGNGNGAGLYANKINIQRGTEVLTQRMLHRGRLEALKRGPAAVKQYERDMKDLLDGASEAHAYEGTFLEPLGREDACRSLDPKSKGCVTHGSADWIECRKFRAIHCYKRMHTQWMMENLTPAEIEAHRQAGTAAIDGCF